MFEKITRRAVLAWLIMVTVFSVSARASNLTSLTQKIDKQKKIVESRKDVMERAFDRYDMANDKYRQAKKKKYSKKTIAKLKKRRNELLKDYKVADRNFSSANSVLREFVRERTIKTETVSDLKKKIANQQKHMKNCWSARSKAWKNYEKTRDKYRYAIKKKWKKSTIAKLRKYHGQRWKAFVRADTRYSKAEDIMDDYKNRLKAKLAAQNKKSNQLAAASNTKSNQQATSTNTNANSAQGKVLTNAISSSMDGF